MKYELIKDSHAGVIIDPTPVLLDVKDTFKVSFVLPQGGSYIALFKGEDGVEHKAVVYGSDVVVPREIIGGKEQLVGLTVCLIDEDKVLWAWECHPFKVGAFLIMRQRQRQLSAGLSEEQLFARLAEIERIHAETLTAFDALKNDYSNRCDNLERFVEQTVKALEERKQELASLKEANELLVEHINKATDIINELSKRIYDLEKNYDPTIIG